MSELAMPYLLSASARMRVKALANSLRSYLGLRHCCRVSELAKALAEEFTALHVLLRGRREAC